MPQGGGPGGASAMPPGQSSQSPMQGMPQQGPMPPGGVPPQAQRGPLRPPMPQAPAPQQQPQMGPQGAPQQPGGQIQPPDPQVILQKVGQAVQRALPPGAPPELQKAVMDQYFDYLGKATASSQPEVRAAIENAKIAAGIYKADLGAQTKKDVEQMKDTESYRRVQAQQEGALTRANLATQRAVQVANIVTQRVRAGQVDQTAARAWSDATRAASAEVNAAKSQITAAQSAGAQPYMVDPNDETKVVPNPKFQPLFDKLDAAQKKLDKIIERANTLSNQGTPAAPTGGAVVDFNSLPPGR